MSCNFLNPNKEEILSLEKDFETISINNKYAMSIPNYMKQTNQLNDEASLQFNNLFKEAYVIVIDESKTIFVDAMIEEDIFEASISTIEQYRDIQIQHLNGGINISNKNNSEKLKINNMDALQVSFVGKIPDVKEEIAYLLTFVEGENNLYMIMNWTLNKYSKKHQDTFQKMANSFREL